MSDIFSRLQCVKYMVELIYNSLQQSIKKRDSCVLFLGYTVYVQKLIGHYVFSILYCVSPSHQFQLHLGRLPRTFGYKLTYCRVAAFHSNSWNTCGVLLHGATFSRATLNRIYKYSRGRFINRFSKML